MHSILAILALALAASIALNICFAGWLIGAIFHATQPSAEAEKWRARVAIMAAQIWQDVGRVRGIKL